MIIKIVFGILWIISMYSCHDLSKDRDLSPKYHKNINTIGICTILMLIVFYISL